MSKEKVFVDCIECDEEFQTSALKVMTETVECPFCGYVHALDDDANDDDELFWYLTSNKKTANVKEHR